MRRDPYYGGVSTLFAAEKDTGHRNKHPMASLGFFGYGLTAIGWRASARVIFAPFLELLPSELSHAVELFARKDASQLFLGFGVNQHSPMVELTDLSPYLFGVVAAKVVDVILGEKLAVKLARFRVDLAFLPAG